MEYLERMQKLEKEMLYESLIPQKRKNHFKKLLNYNADLTGQIVIEPRIDNFNFTAYSLEMYNKKKAYLKQLRKQYRKKRLKKLWNQYTEQVCLFAAYQMYYK